MPRQLIDAFTDTGMAVCASSSYVLFSSLELSDTQVYEPQIRALLGTAVCAALFGGVQTGLQRLRPNPSHWRSLNPENRGVVVTEAGSYLRLIDSCITQLKAQGPSKTCNESKEEEEV